MAWFKAFTELFCFIKILQTVEFIEIEPDSEFIAKQIGLKIITGDTNCRRR